MSKWLKTYFHTPIIVIDIDYFRDLKNDLLFQKQKKEIISEIEREVDYYILQLMYAHMENIEHISELTQIMNEQLFKEVKGFKDSVDSHIEGLTKMRGCMEPPPEVDELPPKYQE